MSDIKEGSPTRRFNITLVNETRVKGSKGITFTDFSMQEVTVGESVGDYSHIRRETGAYRSIFPRNSEGVPQLYVGGNGAQAAEVLRRMSQGNYGFTRRSQGNHVANNDSTGDSNR